MDANVAQIIAAGQPGFENMRQAYNTMDMYLTVTSGYLRVAFFGSSQIRWEPEIDKAVDWSKVVVATLQLKTPITPLYDNTFSFRLLPMGRL